MAEKNVYSRYLAMKGHPGYFQNPVSLKIKYIKVHNGVPVRIATKKTKITEAKKVVDEYLVNLFSSNPKKDLLKKKGITTPLVSVAWDELMSERDASRHKNTKTGYDVSWRIGIEPFWGKRTVLDFNPKVMAEYERWYLKKHGDRVFFNTGKHLAMLIRYCLQNGYISKSVAVPDIDLVISTKTQKEAVGRVYTQDEYEACISSAHNPMVRVAITCYRHMGMRKMELLSAQRKHWDLKKRTAKIWSAKNKKWRLIVIPEAVALELSTWIKESADSEWLFPAPTDPKKHVASQVFDKAWSKTKIAAKLRDAEVENAARVHDWRHTFATQTARDGWPPIAACHVLDMSLQEYQDTYTHVSLDDIMSLMLKSFGGQK